MFATNRRAGTRVTRPLPWDTRLFTHRSFLTLAPFLVAALLGFTGVLPVLAQSVPAAELKIISDPADAVISIDRTERGSTPITIANLPPGEHLVLLSKRGYRDHYATVNLSAATRRTLDVTLEPLQTFVVAHSTPTGAAVSVNGIDMGVTPLLLTTLPPGIQRLRFSLAGFQATEREIVTDARTPIKVTVEMASDSATLVIETQPAGAVVTINGILRGETPCTIERIPEGEALVIISAVGYQSVSERIKLAAGKRETMTLVLQPKPAQLLITSLPPGARVYVNNDRRGETPLTLAELEPGTYRIRVELDGFDPLARDVELGLDAKAAEEFRLTANTGTIQLTTTPAGVEIFIAGTRAGTTVAGSVETTNLSNPLLIEGVNAGAQTLKLVRKGWAEKTLDVIVIRGQTLTQHIALDRLFIPDYEVITLSGTVYRGVFDAITELGVRMETAPGIMAIVPHKEIRKRGTLRDDAQKE